MADEEAVRASFALTCSALANIRGAGITLIICRHVYEHVSNQNTCLNVKWGHRQGHKLSEEGGTYRMPQAHRAHIGVGLCTKFVGAGAEGLGLGQQLHMCLNPYHRFILHLHGTIRMGLLST